MWPDGFRLPESSFSHTTQRQQAEVEEYCSKKALRKVSQAIKYELNVIWVFPNQASPKRSLS